ncbi:MAG: DUF5611 family protein [Methanosarcinales archaeon]|nr:DUF5611 family protein [Methanosarcinales archaeon]
MQNYKLKRGFSPDIDRIKALLDENFPCDFADIDDGYKFSYGAFESCTIQIVNKRLMVESSSSADASDDVVLDTNSRYRKFLLGATGYTAKQRSANMKKDAQKG